MELHKPYWKEATELSEAKGRGAWEGRQQPAEAVRGQENVHLFLRAELLPCSPIPAIMGTPRHP